MTTLIHSNCNESIYKPSTTDKLSTDESPIVIQNEDQRKEATTALMEDSFFARQLQNGSSVMAHYNTTPDLSPPSKEVAKASVEQAIEIKKMAGNVSGNDAKTLEHVAALASTVMSQNPTSYRSAESQKTPVDSAIQPSSSTRSVRSQAAVGGGTDITPVNASGAHFVNVVGDLRLVSLANTLTVVNNMVEAQSNVSASNAVTRVVEAAGRAGQKGIDAAQQRLTGAITSGGVGMALQGGTTFKATKALSKESASINNNVKVATKLEEGVQRHKNIIASATNNMQSNGIPLEPGAVAAMSKGHPGQISAASDLRSKHNIVQNETQQTRMTTELANQAIHSGQRVVEEAFGVQAAQESKQAELARADQSVNNELSNTHQQTAKKSADAQAATAHMLENVLSNNNSALSAVAEHIR